MKYIYYKYEKKMVAYFTVQFLRKRSNILDGDSAISTQQGRRRKEWSQKRHFPQISLSTELPDMVEGQL